MSSPSWLTPEEVRAVVFDNVGALRRGYNENQVDDFLDLVVTSLRSMGQVIADQRHELDLLREEADDKADARISAGQLVSEAREYAVETVRRADAQARQIVDDARQHAARMVAEAGQDIAASAVEVGTRLAIIRDALTDEVQNFYGVIGRLQNDAVRQR